MFGEEGLSVSPFAFKDVKSRKSQNQKKGQKNMTFKKFLLIFYKGEDLSKDELGGMWRAALTNLVDRRWRGQNSQGSYFAVYVTDEGHSCTAIEVTKAAQIDWNIQLFPNSSYLLTPKTFFIDMSVEQVKQQMGD